MGRWAIILAFVALPAPLPAQSAEPERAAVLATLQRLFDGMRRGDSAAVRSTFHPDAFLATTVVREQVSALKVDTLEAFIRAVGTPHDEVWDERLRSEEVRIDGPLASVWTEYSFYAGATFSHCGVNAFQLARTADGWCIIALTDTRRRAGCPDAGGG
ncbi:MAG TPA: nuclear transport factor 2 family protein [Gemmatimonadales bacterium]|nr:nuclear transport factor 2 family protein [Gemmatimonadales bacterium]